LRFPKMFSALPVWVVECGRLFARRRGVNAYGYLPFILSI